MVEFQGSECAYMQPALNCMGIANDYFIAYPACFPLSTPDTVTAQRTQKLCCNIAHKVRD